VNDRRKVKFSASKVLNICKSQGVDNMGSRNWFTRRDKIKNIDPHHSYEIDPNNEYNVYYKQCAKEQKDNWPVGTLKNRRSKSSSQLVRDHVKKEYQFSRNPTDNFTSLPNNHPHEVKKSSKNQYRGSSSEHWACNINKYDRIIIDEGWRTLKNDDDIFNNPFDGQKIIKPTER